jgi:protein-tyrosine phosphatase
MIDFHTHTLPYADHGCDGEETARLQLAAAVEAGVEALCVTPHFYPHRHTLEIFREKRRVGLSALETIEEKPLLLHGAEVLLCEEMHRMEGIRELCIGEGNVMLLEMPNRPFSRELADTVRGIEGLGIVPVLAHIERYPTQQRLAALDVCPRVQMNLEGMTGLLQKGFARKMAELGLLYAVGSDMHGKGEPYRRLAAAKRALGPLWEDVQRRTKKLLGL